MTARDYGYEAQQAAEKHLDAIYAAQEATDEADENGIEPPEWPPTAGPWCGGCDTCMVRETLFAAWPILLEAARAEIAAEAG